MCKFKSLIHIIIRIEVHTIVLELKMNIINRKGVSKFNFYLRTTSYTCCIYVKTFQSIYDKVHAFVSNQI